MVAATITRVTTKESGEFAVRDLSPGGARFVGELDMFEGERVELAIDLDVPVRIAADVVHVNRQRKIVEVAFRELSAEAAAQIERSISEMLERVRAAATPTVLVVHARIDVSNALERDLARVNVGARVCAALDDLDEALRDKTARYIAVIVASSFGEAIGPWLQRIQEERKDLRRVILHGEQIQKIEHPAAGRVDAVLRTPWHFKGLARALELPAEDVVTTYDQLVALKLPKND